MAAIAEPLIVKTNVSTLVSIGLGDRSKHDLLLVRDTLMALQSLLPPLPKGKSDV